MPATDPPDARQDAAEEPVAYGRRWLIGVFLVVGIYAVGLGVVGIRDALDALAQARWLPLAVALVLEAITVGTLAMVHKVSALAVGAHLRYREALNLSMGAFTLSHTLPGGGAVGGAFVVQRLRRAGLDDPSAAASIALTATLATATITGLAAVGIAVAVLDATLPGRVLALVLALLVGLLGAAIGVVALLRSPKVQDRLLSWLSGLHRRVRARIDDWAASLRSLREAPPKAGDLARIVAWSAVNWSVDIAALWLVFIALDQPVTLSVLLIGFGVSQIGAAIPLTPGGVGFVESGMVGAFVVLGVPAPVATTIVLAYRVLATWLPSLAGVLPLLRPPPVREQAAPDAG
ncbi:lysylphosphatidylglycerol synthase transmembrane domain-containing protein [Nitriliruptor alkaliphilus]|uniref:lysylphosphatidylglycerol synthase transmembrane domain-containing protein n=1 Tax=Nitriliruptor alkaliphilus TaxID=427918 RepID=UPI0006965571|nr:lysylphosphatidylglycerol synthase transmembrane domain-containing protein [Nitriliruptor alkaliphilus]